MDDPMRGVFQGFDIAAAGLRAELQRSEVVVANLSNMHDTGNVEDLPYRRKGVVFKEAMDNALRIHGVRGGDKLAAGVVVREVYEDHVSPYRKFYDEGHPDAYRSKGPQDPNKGEDGWVYGSNVNLFYELVDLMMIERSYQAKLASMRSYRNMVRNTISNIRSNR